MSDDRDQWGFKDFLPCLLIVGGACLLPEVELAGIVLIIAGVVLVVKSLSGRSE